MTHPALIGFTHKPSGGAFVEGAGVSWSAANTVNIGDTLSGSADTTDWVFASRFKLQVNAGNDPIFSDGTANAYIRRTGSDNGFPGPSRWDYRLEDRTGFGFDSGNTANGVAPFDTWFSFLMKVHRNTGDNVVSGVVIVDNSTVLTIADTVGNNMKTPACLNADDAAGTGRGSMAIKSAWYARNTGAGHPSTGVAWADFFNPDNTLKQPASVVASFTADKWFYGNAADQTAALGADLVGTLTDL